MVDVSIRTVVPLAARGAAPVVVARSLPARAQRPDVPAARHLARAGLLVLARLTLGVLAPALFLAYAIRCWATGSARLFGMPGNLAGNEAVAAGIASAAVALFLFSHCFVKRDGVLGWAKDPGKLIALVGVALSIGYVGFRAVAGTMA